MIKWIFFDVGSTLVDETICEETRISYSTKDSKISPEQFRNELRELSSQNKDAYKIICEKYDLKKCPWPSQDEREIEGVKEVLAFYKNYFQLGIIANQPPKLLSKLMDMELDSYFDIILGSADIGLKKPDPRIFEFALKEAKIVPEEALMVGDRLDNDILPAMDLGMKTCWIKRSYGGLGNKDLLPKKIDYICNDIKDMLKINLLELTDYQEINRNTINAWAEEGWEWSKPIDHETYLKALDGDYSILLTPTKPMPKEWLGDIKGKKVLALASGGGQQGPLLKALGADVTVLDYSDLQLEAERYVATRENYHINLVQADMTKPFPFNDEEFDIILNPVSFCYIEELDNVFSECNRVLKKGGKFITAQDNSINYITDDKEKEIKFSLPFNPRKNKDIYQELIDEDAGMQFSHSFVDIFKQLFKNNFEIIDLYEDINNEGNFHDLNIPSYYALIALKK